MFPIHHRELIRYGQASRVRGTQHPPHRRESLEAEFFCFGIPAHHRVRNRQPAHRTESLRNVGAESCPLRCHYPGFDLLGLRYLPSAR